ncbi:MAG: transposase [Bacteroidota bacterium]
MKNKYDSSVVFLYATGNEDLLPEDFRKKIPYSTISTWRKTNFETYTGNEFRYFFDDAMKLSRLIHQVAEMKSTMRSLTRAWFILSKYIQPELIKRASDRYIKKKIVIAILLIKKHIGLIKTLKLLGISQPQFQQWMLELRFDCSDSFTDLCMKNHPRQLNLSEIKKIRAILNDPEWNHWPVTSLASKALRENVVIASADSWYKYAKIFGIKRKLQKKTRKKIGLIAEYPNEYWHCDLTEFEMENGKKAYITFVMDNFSKMILGYYVRTDKTFRGVIGALKMALVQMEKKGDCYTTQLVTDGGKENVNLKVHEFLLRLTKHRIKRITALKDIQFSNSPIEAVHRTLKGRYLPKKKFYSIEELNAHLEWAVNDYNHRPHYKHKPRTPHEVYFNIPLPFDVKERMKKAMKKRIEKNLNGKCKQCICNKTGKCQKPVEIDLFN